MKPRTQLGKALQAGLQPGGNLAEALDARGDAPLTVDEAHDVCGFLAEIQDASNLQGGSPSATSDSALHHLTGLFQLVDSREVALVLQHEGIPHLVRLYDASLTLPNRNPSALLFVLKVLAMHDRSELVERLAAVAQDAGLCEGFLWSVLFRCLGEEGLLGVQVCNRLSQPLPLGFAAVALLDFANVLCLAGRISRHPYDTTAGRRRLRDWLTSTDVRQTSCAKSATVALPFLTPPERDELLDLAQQHPSAEIRLEAAWAAARLGHAAGIRALAQFCLDPRTSKLATAYLEDLGQVEAVPKEAQEPDFRACAEMCAWLAHPQEFGRPPEQIELLDTREICWPPTRDRRRLWLFHYRYPPHQEGGTPDTGVGMVGSVTFALFGETTADLPAEDIYALHCCWELEWNRDPRAPGKRSVAAGRQLLEATTN
jgi:hypothetical protein